MDGWRGRGCTEAEAQRAAAGLRRRTVHKDVRIVLRWRQPGTAAARPAVTSSA